jgi:plastocyanin
MKLSWTFTALAIAALAVGCGGGSPTQPSSGNSGGGSNSGGGGGTTAPTVTIDIVGSVGSAAYSPNPVHADAGNMLVWKNSTGLEHHIVMDDGSADFGTIAPGASSTAKVLPGTGGNYHCTFHPSMVGSINGDAAPAPPGSGGDPNY